MTKKDKFEMLLKDAEDRLKAGGLLSDEAEYLTGYIRGLRRAYNGSSYGTEVEHKLWSGLVARRDQDSQKRGQGYLDGMKALQPRKRPTASLTLPRKLLDRMEQEKLPGESRSAQATRLIMTGLKLTEKEKREIFE